MVKFAGNFRKSIRELIQKSNKPKVAVETKEGMLRFLLQISSEGEWNLLIIFLM
jgi:hypothetical protein